MPNQCQFVRQTAAVLLSFVLIAGLLPGFVAAQDLSTVEKRTAWIIEQRRGESIGYNVKFGAATALARLALNADDAEVIDRITHFYDRVPAGSNGQQFSYPGFWGTGTPAECVRYVYRDKLYAMGSGFFQYYPDEYYVDYTAFRLLYQTQTENAITSQAG